MSNNLRNIAIFAHVDAGKTSITENLLFHANAIRNLGSVDQGNTQTDTLSIEKQRGITVNSSVLSFNWKTIQINLIDTPGNIDFSSETQKAFLAIDSAIIVISAVEGIQAQTENLIQLLLKTKKPFLIFINKIDRIGADIQQIFSELKSDLNLDIFPLQNIKDEASNHVEINNLWNESNFTSQLIEKIVTHKDHLFEKYLNNETLSFMELNRELASLCQQQKLIPLLIGTAKYHIGIEDILNGITSYLPAPKPTKNTELFGVVFKSFHLKDGKWLAVRLFNGEIKTRTSVFNASQQFFEKASLIKSIQLNKQQIIDSFSTGEIALIKGFSLAKPGDFIGSLPKKVPEFTLSKPLLSIQIIPNNNAVVNKLVSALNILNNEDPDLDFVFFNEEREFHLKIHGEIQKEILKSLLQSRFNLSVSFSSPTVIYKETPTVIAEGYVRYWLPKPCWAILKFKIEPLETGKGIQYKSIVGVNKIKQQYQNDVEKSISTALKQGILGWEVDDVKITLIDGEDHVIHTKSNDFTIATPMGIMDGLSHAKTTLLEPILSFKIKTPSEFTGKIQSEIIAMRGVIAISESINNQFILEGKIPLATSMDFPIKLSSITSGKAKLSTRFLNYQKCDIKLGKTRKFKGISPLDTAKYILKARKALSG